ncbi:hypothetical protein NDA12_003160 [Ustilago hordei]|nr:hypothetical protein NDA12_003160 [Ustilago hordei]KAJ1582101.1 hypothetical protein NDA15_002346 [Ustilago hordei]
MKLNIAIVALALSSTALTFAAPLPTPMPQGWGLLKKAVGKISGKSSSAAQELSIYADSYVPQYERFSDATHPYIPKEHSSQASPVHRSYGGGDSSRPAARDPRHGGDESGHWTSPPDDNFVGMVKLSPPENYYRPQYTPHTPQHASYDYHSQPQYTPHTPQHASYDYHSQPQYTPHTPQHASYDYHSQPQYTPHTPQHASYDYHSQPQYTPHTPQHASYDYHSQPQYTPHTPQHASYDYHSQPQPNQVSHGHAWLHGPPGEVVSQQSSHDVHGYPVGEYLNGPPPEQNRVGWFF